MSDNRREECTMATRIHHATLPILILFTSLCLPAVARSEMPKVSMLVGTPACPKLNAHDKHACRFNRPGGHGFQVWPDRISIQGTNHPTIWLVTSKGHSD